MAEAQDYLVDEGREVFERLLREKRRIERQDAVVEVSSEDSSSGESEGSSAESQELIEEGEDMAMEGFLS